MTIWLLFDQMTAKLSLFRSYNIRIYDNFAQYLNVPCNIIFLIRVSWNSHLNNIEQYKTILGKIYNYWAIFRNIWQYQAILDNIGHSSIIGQYQTISCNAWQYQDILNIIGQYHNTFKNSNTTQKRESWNSHLNNIEQYWTILNNIRQYFTILYNIVQDWTIFD